MDRRITRIFLAAILLFFCVLRSAQAQTIYHVYDLGVLSADDNSKAWSINIFGQVAGESVKMNNSSKYQAFLWDTIYGIQNIYPSGSDPISSQGINNAGSVVGYIQQTDRVVGFVKYLGSGGVVGLTSIYNSTRARGINNNDWIVGSTYEDRSGQVPKSQAVILTVRPMALPNLSGDDNSFANSINDANQIVGSSYNGAATTRLTHAFIWDAANGTRHIPGLSGYLNNIALAINNAGQVVGFSHSGDHTISHVFVWDSVNGTRDLQLLAGFNSAACAGYGCINNRGQVVGTLSPGFYNDSSVGLRPFLWDRSQGTVDLTTLFDSSGQGWTQMNPTAINDWGQIVGYGTHNGLLRAFMLAPINNYNLLWHNTRTGDPVLWYMSGAYMAVYDYLDHNIPTDWQIVASADLNQDGQPDLIWRNKRTGDLSYWRMNGSRVQRIDSGIIAYGVPLDWKVVGTGDVKHTGNSDIVWQNTQTGDVVVWYMNGANWTGNYSYLGRNIPSQWQIVGVGDIDRDGTPDLIWQNTQTGDVTVWYLNWSINGTTWTGNYAYLGHNVPLQWKVAGLQDCDGDGKLALLWRNTQTGDVVVWYMNGANWTGNWDYLARNVPLEWNVFGFRR